VDKGLLDADDISGILEVVSQYGRRIIAMPDCGFNIVDVYPITGQEDSYDVDIPLWTAEEGRSDLMLQVHVENGCVKVVGLLVP
jgi:hypothetical protein